MNDAANVSSGSPPASLPEDQIRLSIMQLLVLTTSVAIALGVMRSVRTPDDDGMTLTWYAMEGLRGGLSFGALVIIIQHQFRHSRFRLWEPGHWFLFAIGIDFVGDLALFGLGSEVPPGKRAIAMYSLVHGIVGIMIFSLAARRHWFSSWRVLFLGYIAAAIITMLTGIGFTLPQPLFANSLGATPFGHGMSALELFSRYLNLLIPFWLLVVAIVDVFSGARRGTFHWLGVLVAVALLPSTAVHLVGILM